MSASRVLLKTTRSTKHRFWSIQLAILQRRNSCKRSASCPLPLRHLCSLKTQKELPRTRGTNPLQQQDPTASLQFTVLVTIGSPVESAHQEVVPVATGGQTHLPSGSPDARPSRSHPGRNPGVPEP